LRGGAFWLGLWYFSREAGGGGFCDGFFIEVRFDGQCVRHRADFRLFRVQSEYQHRVLFWGFLAVADARHDDLAGVELINRFDWILLRVWPAAAVRGGQMLFSKEESDPEKSHVLRLARRLLPVAKDFDGQNSSRELTGAKISLPLVLVC